MLFRSVWAAIGYSAGSVVMTKDGKNPQTAIEASAAVDQDHRKVGNVVFDNISLLDMVFEIDVAVSDGKGKTATYTLRVERTDEPILEYNLEDLSVVDESEAGDGLYELDPAFDSDRGRYNAVIDYTDRTIRINATAKSAEDKITAWVDDEIYNLTSGEDSPEIMLPTEFLASDDATTTVYVKVESRDGNSGIYEIVLTRSERKKGNARLESMSIEAADKAVAGQRDRKSVV